mmetsp:Transcript_90184/g.254390  ORF Transcript_90184/g.254390 Transcript_90184/m.254390 type:complete len:209 (+) Transcript_90184:557-1183(+)
MAITKSDSNWPRAPHTNSFRRPHLSMNNGAGSVPRRSTKLVMVWQALASKRSIALKIRGPKYMTMLMPWNCCKSCNATPMASRLRPRLAKSSLQRARPMPCSASTLHMISWSSVFAPSSGRYFRSARSASRTRPCCTSQRGDLGKGTIPKKRNRAGSAWSHTAIRQPLPPIGRRSWSSNAAMTTPTMSISWKSEVSLPRNSGGAISAW